jgi:predicted ATPase
MDVKIHFHRWIYKISEYIIRMIYSITISEAFHTGEGSKVPRAFAGCAGGFPLPSLPAGHRLETDSYLVLIIGDNGSGKTTLLTKMSFQYQFPLTTPEFVECDSRGEKIVLGLVCYSTQMNEYGYSKTGSEAYKKDRRLPHYSQGEFRLDFMKRVLGAERPASEVLLFDQPEDGVALKRRQELVDLMSTYAFEKKRQIFVATHEPRFLDVGGSLVINMDDHPASVCRAEDFDIENYARGMLVEQLK